MNKQVSQHNQNLTLSHQRILHYTYIIHIIITTRITPTPTPTPRTPRAILTKTRPLFSSSLLHPQMMFAAFVLLHSYIRCGIPKTKSKPICSWPTPKPFTPLLRGTILILFSMNLQSPILILSQSLLLAIYFLFHEKISVKEDSVIAVSR